MTPENSSSRIIHPDAYDSPPNKQIDYPQRVIEIFLCFFSAWTLSSILVVHLKGSLIQVVIFSSAFAFIFFRLWKKFLPGSSDFVLDEAPCRKTAPLRTLSLSLLAFGASLPWIHNNKYFLIFWFLGVIILAANFIILKKNISVIYTSESRYSKSQISLIGILAFFCILFSLVVHRPDADDTSYISMAVAVADGALAQLPTHITLFPKGTSSLYPPFYKFLSYPHFVGFLSWLFNAEPLAISAFVLTPFFALLVLFAYTHLFRILLPQVWPWALCGLLMFFIVDGSVHRFFSNLAFVRIWQGRSILFHILIPLCFAYGLLYGSRGGKKNFLMLIFVQMCSVGISSPGLWMSPTVVCISAFVGSLGCRRAPSIRRLGLTLLTCAFPIIIGLCIYVSSRELMDTFMTDKASQFYYHSKNPFFAFNLITREGGHRMVWMSVLLLSGLLAPNKKSQWFFTCYTLIMFLTFLNPFLAKYIAQYITSALIYHRVIYLIPVPVMGAALLCWSLKVKKGKISRIGIFITIFISSLYVFGLPVINGRYLLTGVNRVTISRPFLKVYRNEYDIARFLTDNLPSGSQVIAPERVSEILPTLRNCLYPIAPRKLYLSYFFRSALKDEGEYSRRLYATNYVSGREWLKEDIFTDIIDDLDIRGIVTKKVIASQEPFSKFLAQKGFMLISDKKYNIYLKKRG